MHPDSASLWESIRATDEQRHRINETLRDGERLLWLGRPKPGTGKQPAIWGSLVFAIVFYYFWLAMLWPFFSNVNMQDPPWFSLLLFTAIALLPLSVIASLLPLLWAERCNVYAVTNRRAIALSRGLFRYRLKAWDAQDYLEIRRGKNGTGSIVYEYRETDENTLREGLLFLPDVETVAALVKAPASECSSAPSPERWR